MGTVPIGCAINVFVVYYGTNGAYNAPFTISNGGASDPIDIYSTARFFGVSNAATYNSSYSFNNATTPIIYDISVNGYGAYDFINGSPSFSQAMTIYNTFYALNANRFYICNRNDNATAVTGYIAECIAYISTSGGLSNSDRQLVEGYLAWKWNLQGSLLASHPYSSAAPVIAYTTTSGGSIVFNPVPTYIYLTNYNFTTPAQINNTFTYYLSGGNGGTGTTTAITGWSISNGSIAIVNNTGFSYFPSPLSPTGTAQFLLLEWGGQVASQSIYLTAFTYTCSFYAAVRSSGYAIAQQLSFSIDGTNAWTSAFTTGNTNWNKYTFNFTISSPGNHTIGFSTTAATTDSSIGLTQIIITAVNTYTISTTPVAGGATLTTTGTTSPILITNLASATPYNMTITSTNNIGTSAPSANFVLTTLPATPTNLDIVPQSITSTGAMMSFTYPSGTITNYTISSAGGTVQSASIPGFTGIPALWAAYSAEKWISATNILPDLTGNGRNATTSGVTYSTGTGNGATATVAYLSGNTGSTINWPAGSVPANFSICTLSRYTGGTSRRIINSTDNCDMFGHWNGNAGIVYFECAWQTNNNGAGASSVTAQQNWVYTSTTNGSVAVPNNVVVNGVASGYFNNTGHSARTLAINNNSGESTDFQFSQMFIWDSVFTAAQLMTVNLFMKTYLSTGSSASIASYATGLKTTGTTSPIT